uniref:Uncharacterized protein n=1 Tax=Setaria italica TaxID=4555 RepID=K3ZXU4_SETIT
MAPHLLPRTAHDHRHPRTRRAKRDARRKTPPFPPPPAGIRHLRHPMLTCWGRTPLPLPLPTRIPTTRLRWCPRHLRSATVSPASTAGRRATPQLPLQQGTTVDKDKQQILTPDQYQAGNLPQDPEGYTTKGKNWWNHTWISVSEV